MNFDSIRRIVSGKKSRLADHEVGVDLDLSYITDKIIIMGYPATGIESLYRNRRKDVRRWLEARHGKFYKIYNFCPRRENEYDASYFHNQVKRFPFPDHHAPPLSIIPLFVHDITCFLNSSDENVAVIHCKAGKGRSGTMTVCYLMTLASLPQPPIFKDLYIKSIKQLEEHDQYSQHAPQLPPLSSIEDFSIGNQSSNHHSKTEDCKTIDFVSNSPPLDTSIHESSATNTTTTESEATMVRESDHSVTQEELETNKSLSSNQHGTKTPPQDESVTEITQDLTTPRAQPNQNQKGTERDLEIMTSMAEKILSLFQFHTKRRMAEPNLVQYGISIPSQRRSIRYWGDILLGKDPRKENEKKKMIEIKWIKVFVPDTIRYAKILTSKAKVAVQLARYKDSYTKDLREREKRLKELGLYPTLQKETKKMNSNREENKLFEEDFDDQIWEDKEEMINAFASFGQEEEKGIIKKTKSILSLKRINHENSTIVNVERSSTEFDRPTGSRASISTRFTTETSTTGSLIDIDETGLNEETLTDTNSIESEEEIDTKPSRFLTPVRLYDFPINSNSEEGTQQYKKIKGGKNIKTVGGVLINHDCEILLRIVLGSTGKYHAATLPDATLLGYLWFLPAFHEPNFGTFSNTTKIVKEEFNGSESDDNQTFFVTSFPKEEIDFLNANITKIEVAWNRV